jgi:UDP-galactose transporter B1
MASISILNNRKKKQGAPVVEQEIPVKYHNKKCENDSKRTKEEANFLTFHVHPFVKFLFCALGINFSYLNYGIVQEHIHLSVASVYRQSGGTSPRITTFILLSQAVTNAIAARLMMILFSTKKNLHERHQRTRGLNHGLLILTATSYSLAMTASNESLYYVSYPAASLAKSCKLIPSMIAGVLVERKNYRIHEWFGAVCLTSGIVLFQKYSISTTDATNVSPASSVYGFILLFISLFMDGVLGWCQGLLKKKKNTAIHSRDTHQKIKYRHPSSIETMLWTNLYSILFFFPYAIMTGQLRNGISLLNNRQLISISTATSPIPLRLLREMMLLATLAASGQFFIFYTIQEFSPIICATITTTRKFFTILASVYRYGHILSVGQWASVGLVFFGLYVQIVINFFHSSNRSLNVHK